MPVYQSMLFECDGEEATKLRILADGCVGAEDDMVRAASRSETARGLRFGSGTCSSLR